jgi:superfamily II DNA or RNA helicase
MSLTDYAEFIFRKEKELKGEGLKPININSKLWPSQAYGVELALWNLRYANFFDTGMGKTGVFLEYAKQVTSQKNIAALILTPLAVSKQTIEQGENFGIEVNRLGKSVSKGGIYVTNYDQIDNIDTRLFDCIILDESSCLKNHTSKTKQKLTEAFSNTTYKLCCTATPSPNDPMEIGNHSEFLNVLSRNEMLAMYFVHDGGETAKWRLKKHGVNAFYRWMSSYSLLATKPSDLGFSDGGFHLTKLNLTEHKIKTENKGDSLFNEMAVNAVEFNRTLMETMKERMETTCQLLTPDATVIWVKQNEEADYLKKLLPHAVEVRGSQSTEEKEEKLLGFAHGYFPLMITKDRIAMFGLNYQNCHNTILPSPDFSYEAIYQIIRRFYRYGQKFDVNAKILATDRMQNVIESYKRKESQWQEMKKQMVRLQTIAMETVSN